MNPSSPVLVAAIGGMTLPFVKGKITDILTVAGKLTLIAPLGETSSISSTTRNNKF
jgi:hypothetical protein